MKFDVEWSRSMKLSSCTVVLAVLGLFGWFLYLAKDEFWTLIVAVFACVAIVIVLIYYAVNAPSYLILDDKKLILKKIMGEERFPISEIKDIEIYSYGSACKILGAAGYFGYVGSFHHRKIGKFKANFTNYAQAFIVTKHDNKKQVLSCQNRELLIKKIKSVMN